MLQRAASNAYSWWWASHIRTKQSKWMEQNLQDMEEKVQNVLKLIEEDGDSFAKRAEMYYKKRPELISFVEESYKAYRALAERYDHISTELQNANNTIASVFPDRVPFMDEDDDDGSPKPPRKFPEGFKQNIPKPPLRDFKTVVTTATAPRKFRSKKPATTAVNPKAPKSGLSRKEALEEVDKLQKQILALQTVKEFVKSTYDNAIGRYWETEEQIKELQERVSILQDELGEGIVIEDSEARRLMAEAALKSCQEALTQLHEKQERSLNETKIESKRIKDVKAKLGSLMDEFHYDQSKSEEPRARRDIKIAAETKDLDEEEDRLTQRRQELQSIQDNIKEQFAAGSNSSLSVAEMAEKIDKLVNKVISLETAVSSQTALVTSLRTETDELQDQVRTLEGDKESLIKDKNRLNDQLREMEEKLHAVQDLNQIVEDQNSNLQTHFTETQSNLDHLSGEVQNEKQGEEVNKTDVSQTEWNASDQAESKYEPEQVPLNQENVSLNNVRSDKELKVTGLVEEAVKSDKELKVGTTEDDLTSDKKPGVIGSPENGVHADNELKATSSLENGVQSGNEVKIGTVEDDLTSDVIGSPDNGVHTDNELKAAGSLEKDVKSGNEGKVTDSLEMEEATPMDNKSPEEFKEQERILKPADSDEKAIVVPILNTTTENQEVSQHQVSNKADSSSYSLGRQQGIYAKAISSATQDDEPDWRQMFLNGIQDREQVLLTEYTNTLRNYRDVKKRLTEVENKIQDSNSDSSLQLKELKTANAMKDEQIRLLRQKLRLLNSSMEGAEDLADSTSVPPHNIEELLKIEHPESTSAVEEKFRANIDELLDENLTFWIKFSASFAEIQRFETTSKDLQAEAKKIEDKGKALEGSSSTKYSLKSDARPIYKHLTEIQSEITVWVEKSTLLKEELQRRFSSLCDIQEKITSALKASAEDDDFKFTSYQAAKFQGEVLNMKQENNKVADELQAGLDVVTSLQFEVEKALGRLNDQFGLSASRRLGHSETRARVPLRSFIFGVKPKKQSIFSYMTPGIHRKFRAASKGQGRT